jgi:hypothetical protein
MACKISVSLVSERVDGDIGDDWEYSIAAEVSNPESLGSGRLEVPRHKLAPGPARVPPNQGTLTLPGGADGETVQVALTLRAKEVDWVFSDVGEHALRIELTCPEAGAAPVTIEREISAHVEEKPRVLGGSANLIVKLRVVAASA